VLIVLLLETAQMLTVVIIELLYCYKSCWCWER